MFSPLFARLGLSRKLTSVLIPVILFIAYLYATIVVFSSIVAIIFTGADMV